MLQDKIIYSMESPTEGTETYFVLRQSTGQIVVNADLRSSSRDVYTVSLLLSFSMSVVT